MLIQEVDCPACGISFIVDQKLWAIGSVRPRCGECRHYFLPRNSPGNLTLEEAANAAVPIRIWEPAPEQ